MDNVHTVTQYAQGLWIIDEGGVRVFLIEGQDSALLIDLGFGRGDLKAVVEGLTQKPVKVLLTHADGDHTGAFAQFPCVYMHPADFALLRSSHEGGQLHAVYDQDVIDLGGISVSIHYIPGHTPGSIAVLDETHRVLIAGDSVQQGPTYMFGAARSVEGLIISLNALKKLDARYDVILPSHNRLPEDKTLIDKMIKGLGLLLQGELPAKQAPEHMQDRCHRYDYEDVSFFY